MKYPWASASIIAIWAGSVFISIFRESSDPAVVLVFSTIATAIIAYLGFKPSS